MKKMKKLLTLAAGSTAIGLLLGASMTQAQEVCLDNDGDTVIGIKGLTVITRQYSFITIDVDFRYATGYEVYGSGLDKLPFDPPFTEDDPLSVVIAINGTLSENIPVPRSAGQSGQNTYHIAREVSVQNGAEALTAWGGANYTGQEWELCREEAADNCLAGAVKLPAAERHVYAELKRAVAGATCDTSAPPPDTFTITPGITGSWYDIERDGEGYNIEIVGSALDPQVLAYFYTYDSEGNQMWLVGSGPANGDTAIVPVQVTSGPFYGDEYKKEDVVREDWGTLTFTFSSCKLGSVVRESTIDFFGTTTVNFERLTTVVGVSCP